MTSLIRHLNCASMAPPSIGGLIPSRFVCHCLLIEGPQGLTLVDSGFGTEDLAKKRMGRAFIALTGASLDPAETALAQIRGLGYSAADVTDIVVTHLDFDHAGGIGDFPAARVHVFADELEAARKRASILEKNRYVEAQWAHGPNWVEHRVVDGGDGWFGFDSVAPISDDVVIVPTRGHTRGHAAIAVRRPSGGWFLHAGDAYYSSGEKNSPPTCPSGISIMQTLIQTDKKARYANQDRLRTLHADHGDEVTVFCAHDADEFDALVDVTD